MNDLKFAFRQLLKNPGFTTVAVLTLALGLGAEGVPDAEGKPEPGDALVDVGNHKLNARLLGQGTPAVIFSAGLGDDSTAWAKVQEIVSKRFKTFAYDRAAAGQSERGPLPRTMRQEVLELHTALKAANVEPPFILVGHSYGGLIVRLYADQHPGEVVGVVLVDPTHESTRLHVQKRGEPQGQWVRIRENAKDRPIPPAQKMKSTSSTPPWDDYWAEELQQMYESRKKTPEPLGDGPLIVLAAGKSSLRPSSDTPPELLNELLQEKEDQKADLARLSRNAKLVRVPSSGHHIQVDNPELVARAVEDVARAASQGTRLSP